ncbi:MAG: hypothetical protein F4137_01365 [Acidobacteria bacterium]|nr:hypothetical protein [Acidobacteriota bacterium]
MLTGRWPARLRPNRWWVAGYLVAAGALTAVLLVVGAVSSDRTGLNRWVYPNVGFAGVPVLADVSSEVTLDFLDDDPALPRHFFSTRWHGFWHVAEPGAVTLHGAGDDRLDVWLDGELVLRRTPPADMHNATRDLTLAAGIHEIVVEYQQHGGASALRLEWQPRGGRPRGLATHQLFPHRPRPEDILLARQVVWLEWMVTAVWAAPLLLIAPLAARVWPAVRARTEVISSLGTRWRTGLRAALALAVAAVAGRAAMARVPGLNPGSLWYDDLVYAANIRSVEVWDMIAVPLHVGPGLLLIWRGLYALFPDPEWSLQLLPFASAIAAVPVMAITVRRLTGDEALAALAACVAALNPLLVRYSVFVHQFPMEFLLTALFLFAAVGLRRGGKGIDPGRFRRFALLASVGPFFSIPSVFVTFPIVNLGVASAVRDWLKNRHRPDPAICLGAAVYNVTVLCAYLLLRHRSNTYLRDYWSDGFMPLESTAAMLSFLGNNGLLLLDASLPAWGSGPGTVSWTIPFVGLGLGWLLARKETRFFGLVTVAFFIARLVASALSIYPLGGSRVDIFAFPVTICLFAAGIQAATAAFPRPAAIRLAAAAVVVALALTRPVGAAYLNTDDDPLVAHVASEARPEDGLILSQAGIYLTAFYGKWPVETRATDDASHGTAVTLVRDRTLHLPMSSAQERLVTRFLNESGPDRAWYVAFRTRGWEDDVIAVMTDLGYVVGKVRETGTGRLYLGLRRPRQGGRLAAPTDESTLDLPESRD